MIIQWEFRFPVLRIFKERCKQWDLWDSKAMGTGSQNANGMPIVPPPWVLFRSQDSDALCNHEGPPLRRASVPPRERTCQDPAIWGYWIQICSSWYWQNEKYYFNRRSGDWDVLVMLRWYCDVFSKLSLCCGKGLNFSPRICKVKQREAKNLHNTHHSWQHLITPQKKDRRSGCSDGFRLRSPIKFFLIDATSSMLQKSESDVELFCCQMPKQLNMPKRHPLMHHMRLRAAPFTSVIAPPSTKLRLWAIFINSTKRAWYLVPCLSDSNRSKRMDRARR